MARGTIRVTVGGGATPDKGSDIAAKLATAKTATALAVTDSALTTANGTVAGNGTALGLSQATDTAAADANTKVALCQTDISGDLYISVNTTTVPDLATLLQALRDAEWQLRSSGYPF